MLYFVATAMLFAGGIIFVGFVNRGPGEQRNPDPGEKARSSWKA
jgi:hypothetical protein